MSPSANLTVEAKSYANMNSLSPHSSPPLSAASFNSTSTKQRTFYLPLSSHGMPKSPPSLSPGGSFRPHRFSGFSSPLLSSDASMPRTPRTPRTPMTPMSPMSPPMSARSFGTFIDSEPSTPAYSPRTDAGEWDSSALLLLSPVAPSPAIAQEPKWQMMAPVRRIKKSSVLAKKLSLSSSVPPIVVKEVKSGTALTSHPITPAPGPLEAQKENCPPKADEVEEKAEEGEEKPKEEDPSASTAPLEKLATKMKSMLRRKSREERQEKRRRNYEDLQRMETVHWTEM